MQKFIQIRGTGEVYYHTAELAKRDDIDILDGTDDDTPDTVLATLNAARAELAAGRQAEAELVARKAAEQAAAAELLAKKEAEAKAKKEAEAKKKGEPAAPPPPAAAPAGVTAER